MKDEQKPPICSECAGATSNIFAECPKGVLSDIFKDKSWVEFPDHQIIFREKQKAQGVYCIFRGVVKLYKKDKNKKDHTINIAQSSDVLGLQSMMNEDERYTLSAMTLVPTQACFIPKEDFRTFILDYPMMSMQVMKNISDEIDLIEQKMNKIAQHDSEVRLLDILSSLSDRFGTDKHGYLLPDLSSQDIADLVGVSKGHLYKLLSRLKEKNILHVERNRIKITDPHKLEKRTA